MEQNNLIIKSFVLYLVLLIILSFYIALSGCSSEKEKRFYSNENGLLEDCGDPFILKYEGMYYLYCTSDRDSNSGIKVYKSDDLVNWSKAIGIKSGYALSSEDVWGDRWFWSGDVIHKDDKFYMYYTANEHLGVAVSNNPRGPFVQEIKEGRKPSSGLCE